jgi:hypothetical protein
VRRALLFAAGHLKATPLLAAASDPRAASGEQVDDNQNDHDQQDEVDQAATEVHQEPNQPEGEQNHDYRPKKPCHFLS